MDIYQLTAHTAVVLGMLLMTVLAVGPLLIEHDRRRRR